MYKHKISTYSHLCHHLETSQSSLPCWHPALPLDAEIEKAMSSWQFWRDIQVLVPCSFSLNWERFLCSFTLANTTSDRLIQPMENVRQLSWMGLTCSHRLFILLHLLLKLWQVYTKIIIHRLSSLWLTEETEWRYKLELLNAASDGIINEFLICKNGLLFWMIRTILSIYRSEQKSVEQEHTSCFTQY